MVVSPHSVGQASLADGGPVNPHELLGLERGEGCPIRIIEAARRRLAVLRASPGSDMPVKRFLMRQIVAAREAMLSSAGTGSARARSADDPWLARGSRPVASRATAGS
jgi:hypothetical protein